MKGEFYREIEDFLLTNGAYCEEIRTDGTVFLKAGRHCGGTVRELYILPAEITARSPEEAAADREVRTAARRQLPESCTVTVAEDRWRSRGGMYRSRLLSHLGEFRSIFARKCRAVRTDKATANAFLMKNHNYGAANCRHCYGLAEASSGRIVAAATFSNARRWRKEGREIRSYEWVRYASETGTRIPGGMGKLLSAFIGDVRPDDIMSYADLEWSDGAVYRRLGFSEEGSKAPVLFCIDPCDWNRTPVKMSCNGPEEEAYRTREGLLWYMNDGSLKYRLRLSAQPVAGTD